jgi:hypothetical protein
LLQVEDEFLSVSDKKRILKQKEWEDLYSSSHVHSKVVMSNGSQKDIDPLVPLPSFVSETFSDLLFLTFPKISFDDENIDKSLVPVYKEMAVDCLEAAGLNSATGMLFCNMFNIDKKTHWEFLSPTQTLWETDRLGNLTHVIFFKVIDKDDKGNITYHIQEHRLDVKSSMGANKEIIETAVHVIEEYNIIVGVNGKIKVVFDESELQTGLDFIPVIIIWNIGQLNSKIGKSDYQGKEQLFADVDNRFDQANHVLDEHSDPWTFVPAGVLDQSGNFNKKLGKMVEKSGGGNGDNSVDIVSWDASLEANFKMIDELIDTVLFTSRISSSIASRTSGRNSGNNDSGKAVIWKSVQTWTAVKKRQSYWSAFFKSFFTNLGKMDENYKAITDEAIEKMSILWNTNLPMDETADTQNLSAQVMANIKSKLKATKELQDITLKQAEEEQAQINKENQESATIDASSQQPVTL